jgi:uncharacterized DUF497 family protein
MNDGAFQRDDRKAARNYARRRVTFEMAREAFKDPFSIEQIDQRANHGEERFTIIGMVNGRLLFVAYTMRGETIRIISARGAEPYEQRDYHEQNT